VGLVGYAAKALKSGGVKLDPDLAMGIAVPVVIALAAIGIRNIRKHLSEDGGEA
jgi:uncharacterized membrane-anchored protein